MIEPAVLQRADLFVRTWKHAFANFPRYSLDYTWPSVGVVDAILHPLRSQPQPWSDPARDLILQASAYLGVIAYSCWVLFPDSPNISVSLDENKGVVIRSAKSKSKSVLGKPFELFISEALTRVLQSNAEEIGFFLDATTSNYPESSVTTFFSLGLMTGLSPFGEGPWNSATETEAEPRLRAVNALLAASSANYYASVYPGDSLGKNTKLYGRGVILPPLEYNEPFLAVRGTHALSKLLQTEGYSRQEILTVAINLAGSPDLGTSLHGLAIAIALQKLPVDARLLGLVQSKGVYSLVLSQAIQTARTAFGLEPSWGELLVRARTEQDETRDSTLAQARDLFSIEQEIGLLPILRISFDSLSREDLKIFSAPVHYAQYDLIEKMIGQLQLKNSSVTPELVLQRALLLAQRENVNDASKLLNAVADQCSTDDLQTTFFEVQAMIHCAKGKFKECVTSLSPIFWGSRTHGAQFLAIAHWMLRAHLQLRNTDALLEVTDHILDRYPSAIEPRIMRVAVLHMIGQENESEDDLTRLVRYSPMDRGVWELLLRQTNLRILPS